ncbi:hypothetical protein AKO1_004857, partial [Acrasis kona]
MQEPTSSNIFTSPFTHEQPMSSLPSITEQSTSEPSPFLSLDDHDSTVIESTDPLQQDESTQNVVSSQDEQPSIVDEVGCGSVVSVCKQTYSVVVGTMISTKDTLHSIVMQCNVPMSHVGTVVTSNVLANMYMNDTFITRMKVAVEPTNDQLFLFSGTLSATSLSINTLYSVK